MPGNFQSKRKNVLKTGIIESGVLRGLAPNLLTFYVKTCRMRASAFQTYAVHLGIADSTLLSGSRMMVWIIGL